MRLLATLFVAVMGLAGWASPALASECGNVGGWVGVPLCLSAETVPVPDVTDQATSAAADTELEAAGFDLGAVTERCSTEADNQVVGQNPAPGVPAVPGSLVDILVSNGLACSSGKPGIRLKGLRLRGL